MNKQDNIQNIVDNLSPEDFELTAIEQEEREPEPVDDFIPEFHGSPNAFNPNVDYARGNRWWE